ncbi:MAG: DUF4345 family protein [Pseudomonadota bacterium]
MTQRFHPSLFQRAVLGLSAVLALWIGAQGLFAPDAFMAALGLSIDNPGGRNEVRAQYGSYFVLLALLWIGGAVGRIRTSTALMVLAVLYVGVLSGRLMSLGLDGFAVFGTYPDVIQRVHGIDAVGAAITLLALRTADRPRPSERG